MLRIYQTKTTGSTHSLLILEEAELKLILLQNYFLPFTFLYYNIIHFISIVLQLRIEYAVDIAGRHMVMNIGTEKSIVFYNSYSTLTVQYK